VHQHSSDADAPQLVAELPTVCFIVADKGYDREDLRTQIRGKGAMPVIPRKGNSKTGNDDMIN
jgi:hypothetical protein